MIKKIFLIGFILVLFFSNVLAQSPSFTWAKVIGGASYDYSYSVVLDNSGNVYTTGYFDGTVDFDPGPGVFNLTSIGPGGVHDIFISKLDTSGNFVWAISICGVGSNGAADIVLDSAGNEDIYVTGIFEGTVDFDPSGGVYDITSTSLYDVFILKLSSSGNFIWVRSIGGIGSENVASIALDPSGNGAVYITGTFTNTVDFDPDTTGIFNLTSMGSGSDVFICNLDASGNFIWAKQLGGIGLKDCRNVTLDQSGNIYTVGWFENTVDFDPDSLNDYNLTSTGNYDIFISKLNNSGNFVWAKNIGGAGFDKGMSMTIDPTGGGDIYLTGVFQGITDFDPDIGIFNLMSVGDFDIFVSKLDSMGNFKWAKSMGGDSYDYSFAITLDALGNIYTTGYFNGTADFDPNSRDYYNLISAGDNDIFIQKLDTAGNFKWAKAIGGTGVDVGLSITIDPTGNLYITGAFYSPTITFDLMTLTNTINFGSTGDIYIAKLENITAGIENVIEPTSFSIYPNPTYNSIFITFLNNFQEVEIFILDINGKTIKSITPKSNYISVTDLSSGIYFIKIVGEENAITQKFIKQ